MAGKGTDRKGKSKDNKPIVSDQMHTLANFTLPDSLPCSEIEFPIVIRKAPRANWQNILKESEKEFLEIEEYTQSKKTRTPKSPFLKTECDYIQNEVFVHLIPALEETLNKAKIWEALARHKCFFNGLDHIAQVLWNNNPRYPFRKESNLHLFNMPWVREHLKINLKGVGVGIHWVYKATNLVLENSNAFVTRLSSPRPYYPKSWLWPEEYAATLIQKSVRQYFVQKEEEVQEMREFWKKLDVEKNYQDIEANPLLAKKFASTQKLK